MRVLLTWSSLSKPGALPYPPSPAHGDWGSADPLMSSHRDKTLPRKPRSATHEPAEGEKGSDIEQDPMLWQPGLAETSWTGIGSGGLGGGGELGLGNDGSSGTKGSGGGRKTKITSWLIRRLGFLRHDHRCFVGIYFQHEQRHRRALWDSCHTAACHCTWWIYRSVTKKRKKKTLLHILGDFQSSSIKFPLKETNLWVELLFCSRVAVLTWLSSLTFTGISPLFTLLHRRTWQRSAVVRNKQFALTTETQLSNNNSLMF